MSEAIPRQQVLAHTEAAGVERSFGETGADPKPRQAARSTLPTIEDHIGRARRLRAAVDRH